MKVLAWVLGALVVASLYEEVHCQCNGATWTSDTYSVDEENEQGEANNVVITAMLGSPLSSTFFLRWSIEEISATEDIDFIGANGFLTFPPGSTSASVDFFTIPDTIFEGIEEVHVNLYDLLQENFCDNTTIQIIDNDDPSTTPAPATILWEFGEYQFQEGENTTNEICAVVVNSTITAMEVRQVIFRNESATDNVDYMDPGELELVFMPGDTRQCIQIDILDDQLFELNETFFADLILGEVVVSTTRIVIRDDEEQIILNVEREIYTVIEGNELEVCVVIADDIPAPFAFHVTGFLYIFNLHLYIRIYFTVGDIRSCGTVFIPGNTYVDKQEREKEITFYVEVSEFSGFFKFDMASAWCYIGDDDIAVVGIAQADFTTFEDSGSVSVCIELCKGSTNRPIDVLLYTSDGTALNGINYEEFCGIVTIPALSVTGDQACTDITILNDGITTAALSFSLTVFIADTHIKIPSNKTSAVVSIQPAFEICFDMDTPRVNESVLFLSFASTVTVDSAICFVETLGPPIDCTGGSATFVFNDNTRTQPYDVTIVAIVGSETRTLENSVRSELTDVCDTHLVNKGVVIVDGSNATITVQPTGPAFDARVTDLECRCNPVQPSFTPCGGDLGAFDIVQFEYLIPDGCTSLVIRQDNSGGTCSPRRALQIPL